MADSEKLTALKKAYADIILNTAKEAAARIMVSERKAQRYQRELLAAKDESLRMLLILKQMLDSKVNEAEMISLNQQKRIEELEAQLGEAEDIVKDLRAELRELQDEFEKVTSRQRQPSSEQISEPGNATLVTALEDNRLSISGSIIFSLPALQCDSVTTHEIEDSNFKGTCNGGKCGDENDSHKDNGFVCSPDFASIMMRSKEPELYRNGCTQRIRAFEQNVLGGNLSLSAQADEKSQMVGKGEQEGEDKDMHVTAKVDNVCDIEISPDTVKDILAGSVCRKRKIKRNLFLSGQDDGKNQMLTREKDDDKDGYKILTPKVDNGFDTKKSSDIVKDIPRRLKRKRAARYRRHNEYGSFPHPAVDNNVETEEDSSTINDTSQKDPECSLSNETETIMHTGFIEVTKSEEEFDRTGSFKNATDNGKLPILTVQDAGSAENSGFPVSKTDYEMAGMLMSGSNLKEPDTMNKFLKYTFQRKKKKEFPSSPDGDSSIEHSTLNRKMGANQSGYLESQNSGLIVETSRDTRRMAQVARQLISLSEKKWR